MKPPPHWSDWLPAAMAGQMPTANILPLLPNLTPQAVAPSDVLALWQWLFDQLPAVPGLDVYPNRLDTCGTGGSGMCHFNTSTTVALLLASMGIPVIKFGNRAATSQSGSFDFLGALGLGNPLPLAQISTVLQQVNLALVYAPQCLPGLKHLAEARKQFGQQTGQKTLFNLLGPLLNPCRPTHQLLGTAHHADWMQMVLTQQQVTGWIVTGHAGQDDVTPWGQTVIRQIHDQSLEPMVWRGPYPTPTQPWPDTVTHNVATFWAIANGQDVGSPAYQLVVVNAAASLCIWHGHTRLDDMRPVVTQALKTGSLADFTRQVQHVYGTLTT